MPVYSTTTMCDLPFIISLEVLYLTVNDRCHRHFDPLFQIAFILSALVCLH